MLAAIHIALMILLTILKVIGIAILVILGIVLLVLLLVLFVPIRYKASGSYYEKVIDLKAKVSWLFPLAAVYVDLIDGKPQITIRVFGIRIGKKKDKPNDEVSSDEASSDNPVSEQPAEASTAEERKEALKEEFPELFEEKEEQPEALQTTVSETHEAVEEMPQESAGAAEEIMKEEPGDIPEPPKKEKKKKPEKAPKPKKTPEEKLRAREERQKKIDKLKSIWEMVSAELNDPENSHFLRVVRRSIGKIIHHILPTQIRGKLHIGFEDKPDTMGTILAAAGVLYPLYGKDIEIIPDFEQQIVEGDGRLKGRIRIGTIVGALLRIVFTKRVIGLVIRLLKSKKKSKKKS